MFASTARRCSVRIADVLEDGAVAGLLGMMVDDQIDAIDLAAEVVWLDIHHRHPVVVGDVPRRDDLDVNVEQVQHPQILGPRHALDRCDDRGLLVPAQDVAQGQAAGKGVGIGIVVQEDEHALRVAHEALILLDLQARQRAAELGQQRTAKQLRQRKVVELGKL
jgi:hypothetical protein